MNRNKRKSNEGRYMFTISLLLIVGLIIIGILIYNNQIDKIIYIAIPIALLGCGSLLLYFLTNKMQNNFEYRGSRLMANLEHLQLPKFKLNKKTQRLYQIYNYRILDKKNHKKRLYSSLSNTIKMIPNKGWTTNLYYVDNIVFVNCKNNSRSWWGVCNSFEEKYPIWGLDSNFERYYLDSLKNADSHRVLQDTSIIGANDSQWDPENGYRS